MPTRRPQQTQPDSVSRLELELLRRYGALLTQADVASFLRYPSVHAVQKARARGNLPIPMITIPARRGWYATARAVAEFMDRIEKCSAQSSDVYDIKHGAGRQGRQASADPKPLTEEATSTRPRTSVPEE